MLLENYLLVVKLVGWILTLSGAALMLPPLQYLGSGASAAGDSGVTHYFFAFAACLLVVWGLILLSAASHPVWAQQLAMPSCIGFALLSISRIPLCRDSDVLKQLGKGPMIEIPIFALFALYFGYVWL